MRTGSATGRGVNNPFEATRAQAVPNRGGRPPCEPASVAKSDASPERTLKKSEQAPAAQSESTPATQSDASPKRTLTNRVVPTKRQCARKSTGGLDWRKLKLREKQVKSPGVDGELQKGTQAKTLEERQVALKDQQETAAEQQEAMKTENVRPQPPEENSDAIKKTTGEPEQTDSPISQEKKHFQAPNDSSSGECSDEESDE